MSADKPGAAGNGPEHAGSVLQRKLSLVDMLDPVTFGDVVDSLGELYRVGIRVLDERGRTLADAKGSNGDFCGFVNAQGEGHARCTALVARLNEGPLAPTQGAQVMPGGSPLGGELLSQPCFTGLRYVVMPVLWEGDVLGRVVVGPFASEELAELPASLGEVPGLDLARARELTANVQRMPDTRVTKMLAHFAQVMAALLAAGQKSYLSGQLHLEAMLETQRELESQNAQLLRLNQRLKEADRMKSSFLSTVSHELRTPLASIIGYSEMLAEGLVGALNPEQMQFARTIIDKGNTLLKLISSILDMSQIEAGKVRLAFEWVDVQELVESAITSVMPQAQRKGLTLKAQMPPVVQARVVADREKLRQVVVNLLANAVKFTPTGGKVDVRLSELGNQLELGLAGYRIEVEDSGVGIPEDQRERIFQSFYQVDDSPTREYGGAGLGLAIVKSYVEGHGGQVAVTSELGRGSCFRVVLPKEPPQSSQGLAFIPPPVDMDTEPERF
ncbi:ATP-binding protein [Vitiosangium sp. GDMCC 1.1324]|uniref:ATP-binding protein n=1 Tax=Vitiosangium sp. (strain GDMCC 1.1324) TaxID=2138576 RepID=UPI000D35166B|nr:ATP-binding protein [Vitiosangium sp. GDMCC 1.1324]PTL82940.1 histidine kinase [Vitiosangium sp. GDMCC 1.1324]